jgi:small-conductance mechanosensitive channel
MDQIENSRIEREIRRQERRREEGAAKTVPYVSFLLTHIALVLFLGAMFIVDYLALDATLKLSVKVALVALAVILIACEWIYAIRYSRRWRQDVQQLRQLEEQQYLSQEKDAFKQREDALIAQQQRNRLLELSLRLRRKQNGDPTTPVPPTSTTMPPASGKRDFRSPFRRQ